MTDSRPYDAADDLVVRKLQPYDVPCIERFDKDDILESVADWRADSVE